MEETGVRRTNQGGGMQGYAPAERLAAYTRYNAVRRLKEQLVGGRGAYFSLPTEEQAAATDTAKQLYDLGVDFTTADRAFATEKRGFVYVITHPAFPDYVKIGRAFDPKSRLKGYQTGCPHRGYELYAAIYFEDCHWAEREIHARLDEDFRNGALGEWYYISPLNARHNINKLRSIL